MTDDSDTLSFAITQPDIAISCMIDTGSPCLGPELFGEQQTVEVTTDNPTGYKVLINLASDETCMRLTSNFQTNTPCSSIASNSKINSVPNVQGGITTDNLINSLGTNLWGISLNIHEASTDPEFLAATWLAIPTSSSGNAINITDGDPAAEEAADQNITTITYGVKADPDDGSISAGTYKTEVVYTVAANPNFNNESWSFEVDPDATGGTFVIPTARSNIDFFNLTKLYYELWHATFDCIISPSQDSLPCSRHEGLIAGGLFNGDIEGILLAMFTGGFDYNWIIDWGDGTSEQVSDTSSFDSAGISHQYPGSSDPGYDPNGYTITISPAGNATFGWLNAFGSSAGAYIGGQENRIIGLPEPFPYGAFPIRQGALQGLFAGMTLDCEIPNDLFSNFYQALSDTPAVPANIFDGMFFGTFSNTYRDSNLDPSLIKIPEGIFDGLDTSRGTSFNSTFMETFAYGGGVFDNALSLFGGNSSYVAPELSIPEDLFANLDFSNANTLNSTFAGTFSGLATEGSDYTLPAGLFDFLDAADNITSLAGTFLGTFIIAQSGNTITIPPGFFAHLNTSNVTDFSLTFIFLTMHNTNLTTFIPDDLFAYLDTSQGKKFIGTFTSMFYNLGNIPAGLFDNIDTSNGEDFTGMFCGFTSFCLASSNSSDLEIPSGLFDSLNTSNGTEFYGMFVNAFTNPNSVPAGLFSFLDTSQATSETTIQFFYQTFCCNPSSSIPSVSINDLFDGANLSGLITDPNTLTQTDNSTLYNDFYYTFQTHTTPYLTGDATQFIGDHLGGLNPTSRNYAFSGQTTLSDWTTLNLLWRN
jgi:hypothetical protein